MSQVLGGANNLRLDAVQTQKHSSHTFTHADSCKERERRRETGKRERMEREDEVFVRKRMSI